MELRTGSLDFSLPLAGSGPRTATTTLVFPRAVRVAVAGLSGYTASFKDDHNFGRCEIRIETSVLNNTVVVTGRYGLRDWTGDWDDLYSGTLDFVLLAELEPATGPGSTPRRADLAIVDLELNQATQFFRSNRFLDSLTTQPDNSVFMIARKDTGIRVYIDWDSAAGLPPITRLTGTLTVQTASTTLTLQPINSRGWIPPHRDSAVNQALADDTLNFRIPAANCVGTITVRCEIFDQDAPLNGSSGAFTRSITFTEIEPLSIFLVGVALASPETPAASEAEVTASLFLLRKMYPRGNIEQTGFTTVTVTNEILGCPPSGNCGELFDPLLDMLSDLRGGSGDVYFGALPAGVSGAEGNCIGGCSRTGRGIAAAYIDELAGNVVAHEIAHALGRLHAPCVGCPGTVQNPDPDFPQYGSFFSDSIGVFGFDPASNNVFDPASTLDFMTWIAVAPGSAWVSPYTYRGLLGPSSEGGGIPEACTLRDARVETLFLRMTIHRDGTVKVGESFHHEAVLQGGSQCDHRFSVEFLDVKKNVLGCAPVSCGCEPGGCGCWPKSIRQAIRFPKKSKWMLVYDADRKIHEERIPDRPSVKITGITETNDGVLVKWKSDPKKCWYLVHWFDDRARVWRGVAPRRQDTSLLVPKRLFSRSPQLKIRILATEKISTGYAETNLILRDYTSPQPTLNILGFDPKAKPQKAAEVLRAVVLDSAGHQLPADRTAWYTGKGAELARGDSVDLRQLRLGRHVIRLVVRATGEQPAARSWLVERTLTGIIIHQTISDPELSSLQSASYE